LNLFCIDPVAKFPETTEKPGFFVGSADNVGDILKFKILKNYLSTVLHRSVVRSAADPTYRNERVTLSSDVQQTLDDLDNIPGAAILSDNQPKQISRKLNDEAYNRTRSKTGNIDQNIGDRTWSSIQFIHNSGLQDNVFPLYDAIKFEYKRKGQDGYPQLGLAECRTYQSFIFEPKLQFQLDHLRQMHTLDKLEDDHDRSWECIKLIKYTKERTADDGVGHRCLVE
jgi:hypothetical protein